MHIRELFDSARSAKEAFERNTTADTATKRAVLALYKTVEAMVDEQCPAAPVPQAKPQKVSRAAAMVGA